MVFYMLDIFCEHNFLKGFLKNSLTPVKSQFYTHTTNCYEKYLTNKSIKYG